MEASSPDFLPKTQEPTEEQVAPGAETALDATVSLEFVPEPGDVEGRDVDCYTNHPDYQDSFTS